MPSVMDIFQKQKPRMRALSYDECHIVSDLLKEGIPLGQCLVLLKNSKNFETVEIIINGLESGENIGHYFFKTNSDLMMFDFFQSLYSFADALEHCLLIIEARKQIVKNLIYKLVYPITILIVSCSCLIFVCFLVMPNVFSMISSMGIEIDLFLYYVCMSLSVLMGGLLFVISLVVLVVWNHSRKGNLVELFKKIPIACVQEVFKYIFTLLFCTYLNVLLSQQIPTKKALQLLEGIQDGCTNLIANKCKLDLESGISFQNSIQDCKLIVDEYSTIISLGEVSNHVLKYSQNYERLSMIRLEKITKMFIQVVLGVSYGCVALCAIVIMQLLMSPLELFELL